MDTTTSTTTALDAIRRLSADEVEARLIEVTAEQRALATLLQSLRTRDRTRRQHKRPAQGATP